VKKHDDLPDGLREALDSRNGEITQRWSEGARTYLYANSAGGHLFARTSSDPHDVATFAHEARVREIVGAEGSLRTPPVIAGGKDWLLEVAIDPEPFRGSRAVTTLVEATDALQQVSLPAAQQAGARHSPLDVLKRRVTLVRAGLKVRDLIAARRILNDPGLPEVTSHGDFHGGNVFLSDGAIWVVDWEMVGSRAAGYDLMQFWASVEEEEDRAALFEAAVAMVGTYHRSKLARLRYALLVRTIADKLGATKHYNQDIRGGRRLLELLARARKSSD
jgi:hypothetical protein